MPVDTGAHDEEAALRRPYRLVWWPRRATPLRRVVAGGIAMSFIDDFYDLVRTRELSFFDVRGDPSRGFAGGYL